MTSLALILLLAAAPAQTSEEKKIPKDSVEIVAMGCLKGRVFTGIPSQETDTVRGPDVTGRTFRLNGNREVIDVVKKHDRHVVEVVGLVTKAAFADGGPGKRIGNTRVVIGGPLPRAEPGGAPRPPMPSVPVMDVSSVRFVSDVCPIER
jgi:hypothetical protein